jgi:hypothetical protein
VVLHLRARRVSLDGLNALLGVRLCRVTLTGDDDLAVGGLQVEVVLTGDSYRRTKRISRTSAGIEKTTVNATPANMALISFLLIER